VALAYGDDPGVLCTAFGASTLQRLGYAEQARAQLDVAIDLAHRLGIPYCEGMALDVASIVQLYARDLRAAAATLDALDALTATHGFPLFRAHGMGMRGWLLVQQGGQALTAIQLLEGSLAGCRTIGFQLAAPSLMAYLAEALAADGQETRALDVVDEAIATCGRTGELLDLMLALTVKGDLCASASQDTEATTHFERAITIAQRQGAKLMELRAATRLARLHRRQGKIAEARSLLSDIYGWFTEGLDTPDLRDAREVLEGLDAPPPRAKPKSRRATQ
jgi:tetratricopeptide (TPR) repeat protein